MQPGDVEVQQSNGQASEGVVHGKQSDQISEAKPAWFMSSDNGLRLDFTLSEVDPEATGTALEAVPGVSGAEQRPTNVRATEQEDWNGASGQESKFAFNSAILDEGHPLVPLVPASQRTEHTAGPEVLGNSLPAESAGVSQTSALQKPELTQAASRASEEDRSHVTLKMPQPETAPGDATVTEKSTADGAAQKKKKKKQKTSASKKEVEETEVNRKATAKANGCQNKGPPHQDETSQVFKYWWGPIVHEPLSKR